MRISEIEGLGPAYIAKLKEKGITTTEALLREGATRNGRRVLAEKTGLPEKKILEFINRADLMRIRGVGKEYSDLLVGAGVDTVRELSHRRADNLLSTMNAANVEKPLVRQMPTLNRVAHWIEEAKELQPLVTY